MGAGDGLGGCYACIKYLMFAFNFIFWLIGCALVGVGIWVMVDDNFKQLVSDDEFQFIQYAGITLLVVGGVVMVVGFFGCCGAIRESQCLLVMFFICMLLIFIALVAAGVVSLISQDIILDEALDVFKQGVEAYTLEKPVEFVDMVQGVFKCCGVKSSADYVINLGKLPPASCKPEYYLTGCEDAVTKALEQYITLAAGITLGTGAVLLIGLVFSMMLCCAIRDQRD